MIEQTEARTVLQEWIGIYAKIVKLLKIVPEASTNELWDLLIKVDKQIYNFDQDSISKEQKLQLVQNLNSIIAMLQNVLPTCSHQLIALRAKLSSSIKVGNKGIPTKSNDKKDNQKKIDQIPELSLKQKKI